jgi:WXG100 family type VII secretion target
LAVREIAVNTATLARDTAQLTTLLERLEKDKAKMVQEIQELNRMWQGPSNQAFNDQFKTDCTSLDNLCRTIREMIGAMENAKREYDQCDNRVNALVSALKI